MTIGIDGSNDLSLGSEFTNPTTYVNGTASSAVTLNAWNYIIINSDEITPTTLQFGYVSSSYGAFRLKGFMAFNYALDATGVTYYSNSANHPKVIDQTATGVELVTNGGFDEDDHWGTHEGWTISDGVATYGDAVNGGYLTQTICTENKQYIAVVELSDVHTKASLSISAMTSNYIDYTTNQTITILFTATASSFRIKGSTISGGTFNIDNVSVKEAGATLILSPEGMYPGLWRDAYHSIDVSVGTGSTSPRLVKSQAGMNAWRFDGTDDYLTKASAGDGLTGDITIVGWIKPQSITSVSGSSRRIFSNTKTMILIGTAGAIVFYRNGSTSLATANGTIVPETVYYLVITSTSSGTSNIYLNNVLSKTGSNGSPVSSTTYYIGADAAGVGPFLGIIEGLKIYKRLWSAEEISLGYSLYDD